MSRKRSNHCHPTATAPYTVPDFLTHKMPNSTVTVPDFPAQKVPDSSFGKVLESAPVPPSAWAVRHPSAPGGSMPLHSRKCLSSKLRPPVPSGGPPVPGRPPLREPRPLPPQTGWPVEALLTKQVPHGPPAEMSPHRRTWSRTVNKRREE